MTDKVGNRICILIKQGSAAHMAQFRQGLLYMQTLSFFRNLESDPARADLYEGTDHIYQPTDLCMSFDFPGLERFDVPQEDLAGPVRLTFNETERCNIFCLYSVSEPVVGPLFPPAKEWFGDTVVCILNTGKFMYRMKRAAMSQGLSCSWGTVEYYDDKTFTGKLGRFKKRSMYAYQKEFRFIIETDGSDAVKLDIGDISDITSELIPFADADKHLFFTEADAIDAGLLCKQDS